MKTKYKKLYFLGKCINGSVWKVYKKNNCYIQNIVVKSFKINDQTQLDLALNEINILKMVSSHDNVIKYYNYDYQPNTIYIEMQHIEGMTLNQFSKKRKNANFLQSIINITCLLIKGIQYIHEKKIIHNDIKPENIMLDNKLNPKLIDFGLSSIGILSKRTKRSTFKVICCKNAYGTIGYSSPLLYLNHIGSFASDVWGLGATLNCAITGYLPFKTFNSTPSINTKKIKNVFLNEHPIVLKSSNKVINFLVNNCLIKNIKYRTTLNKLSSITEMYK